MQAGDLIFVRGQDIISDLIRVVDKGQFNHVAIAVNETDILEAQYNTKVHIIPNPYNDFEVVALNLAEKSKVEEFAQKYLGEDYDFAEIVRVWFKIETGIKWFDKFNTTKEVICSELAGDYLEFVGIALKGEELLAPNQLYRNIKVLGY